MASEKLKQNQAKTAERMEKQAYSRQHSEKIDKMEAVRQTQLATMATLVSFLKGHTTKAEIVNQLESVKTPDIEKVVAAVEALRSDLNSKSTDWTPIIEMFSKVIEHLEAIPKEHPEMPEQQVVDMSATNSLISAVVTAIKELDLVVNVPQAKLPTPQVNVTQQKVDLTELKSTLVAILESVNSFEIPPFEATDVSKVEEILKESQELLKKILKKPSGGGGGGGGGMVSFKNPEGLSVQVEVDASGAIPVQGVRPTDKYKYHAESADGTYEYLFYEDKDGNWYVVREVIATGYLDFTAGVGGVGTAYQNSTSGPAGTPAWGSYAETF